jgi:excisionase family DNA binding protein
MQLGRAIVLIPENQQLTTQRAADLLGVSRPHLIKLLEAGELPCHKAGSHRRIYLKDLIAYQKRRDMERKAALGRIAKEAFASGLYDRTGIPEGGEDEIPMPLRLLGSGAGASACAAARETRRHACPPCAPMSPSWPELV